MNGCVKSPWQWNEIFDMCTKYYQIIPTNTYDMEYFDGVNLHYVNELYYLCMTESDCIYLNVNLITTFHDVCAYVYSYEDENGEITGG